MVVVRYLSCFHFISFVAPLSSAVVLVLGSFICLDFHYIVVPTNFFIYEMILQDFISLFFFHECVWTCTVSFKREVVRNLEGKMYLYAAACIAKRSRACVQTTKMPQPINIPKYFDS